MFDALKTVARAILNDCIGETDEEHVRTPERYVSYMSTLLCRHTEEMPKLTSFPTKNDEMVFVGPIDFYSLCPHHLALIFGKAYVGYIPRGRVLGLSKIPRLIRWMSGSPIKQEDLTTQIAEEFEKALFPEGHAYTSKWDQPISIKDIPTNGVGIVLKAIHTCMLVRGIKVNSNCYTTTSKMTGCFLDPRSQSRGEFFALMKESE